MTGLANGQLCGQTTNRHRLTANSNSPPNASFASPNRMRGKALMESTLKGGASGDAPDISEIRTPAPRTAKRDKTQGNSALSVSKLKDVNLTTEQATKLWNVVIEWRADPNSGVDRAKKFAAEENRLSHTSVYRRMETMKAQQEELGVGEEARSIRNWKPLRLQFPFNSPSTVQGRKGN